MPEAGGLVQRTVRQFGAVGGITPDVRPGELAMIARRMVSGRGRAPYRQLALHVSDQGDASTRGEAVQHADLRVSPRWRVPEGRLSAGSVEQFAVDADSIIAVAEADATESADGFGGRRHTQNVPGPCTCLARRPT